MSELVDRFGSSRGADYPPAGPAFLEAYLDVLLPEPLLLLSRYGISLDTHLPNTRMVFDQDAVPTAALFRDLGGIPSFQTVDRQRHHAGPPPRFGRRGR